MSSQLRLAAALAAGHTRMDALLAELALTESQFRRTLARLREAPPPVGHGYGMTIEAPGNRTFIVRDWGILNPDKLANERRNK